MKEFLRTTSISSQDYNNYQIGKYVQTDWGAISDKSIVLFSVNEFRGSINPTPTHFDNLRKALYTMSAGNWKLPIVDIGTIEPGENMADTYFAVESIIDEILLKKAFPLIIGGSQDICIPLYRALCKADKPINYTSVDAEIPLVPLPHEEINEKNYLNHILTNEKQLLFLFTNLGYQTFYTSQQLLDTLEKLDFEAVRLGEITSDIKESEPIFRSSDLVSINLNAIESFSEKERLQPRPNGFNSREICALAKYAALSPQLKAMAIFNYFENTHNVLLSELVAQMIWYALDSRNLEVSILRSEQQYKRYIVLHEDKEIVFYWDESVNKWWIAIEGESEMPTLVPCSKNDYEKAKNYEIPDRYWKNIKRYF